MYNNGYSIDDIASVSGFSSRSSIFRILNKYNVDLNRGRTKDRDEKREQRKRNDIHFIIYRHYR